MRLPDDKRKALVDLRIERANETILEVPYLIEQGFYRTAANRLYYACYYIVSALLLSRCFETKTHQGIISMFALNFVKEGIVSIEDGHLYRSLYELRQTGDYDEFKIVDEEDVVSRLQPAEQFIKTIEKLINNE
jgi:uncharacterized protein (UPF0332 family)